MDKQVAVTQARERIFLPELVGRVIDCGRGQDGTTNEVVIDVGGGRLVTLSGVSDEVVKRYARALYMLVRIEVEVQDDERGSIEGSDRPGKKTEASVPVATANVGSRNAHGRSLLPSMDLLSECRTVLSEAYGAMLGVLDCMPSRTARGIADRCQALIAKIDRGSSDVPR